MKIKTSVLKAMTAKAVKGASKNKMMPLTELIEIELEDGKLTLTTTDATNYLYVIENGVEGENFSVSVSVDKFNKLVSRMTSKEIEMHLDKGGLKIKGDGKYTIEYPTESGNPIKFPNPRTAFNGDEKELSFSKKDINKILKTLKPTVCTDLTIPFLCGYFFGERVITTDQYLMGSLDIKVFDEDRLVSTDLMNLLGLMDSDTKVYCSGDNMLCVTDDCVVYGKFMKEVTEYPSSSVARLLNGGEGTTTCKLVKKELLDALSRLEICTTFDVQGLKLNFTDNSVKVDSMTGSGSEVLKYLESVNGLKYNCIVDLEMINKAVKAYPSAEITIECGLDRVLKLTGDGIKLVVALSA